MPSISWGSGWTAPPPANNDHPAIAPGGDPSYEGGNTGVRDPSGPAWGEGGTMPMDPQFPVPGFIPGGPITAPGGSGGSFQLPTWGGGTSPGIDAGDTPQVPVGGEEPPPEDDYYYPGGSSDADYPIDPGGPGYGYPSAPAAGGLSTTTMIAIGVGVIGLILLLKK